METYAAVLSKDRELTEQVAKYNVCIIYLVIGNHSVVYTYIPGSKFILWVVDVEAI